MIELVAHRRPDVIFHLAAQIDVRVSVAHPVHDAIVNIVGSLNVCEGALDGRRVEGRLRRVPAARCTAPPTSCPCARATRCGRSRRTASPRRPSIDYLHYYRESRGLEYTALALANVYGPRQDPHGEAGVVAIFAGKFLAPRSPGHLRRRLADAATSSTSTTSSTRSSARSTRAAAWC